MWKKDKKDFACEMRKMKTLKSQLALMEYNYLIEYQVSGEAGGRGAGCQLLSRHVSRGAVTHILWKSG